MGMLHALRDTVLAHKADIGFAFDGDGDRCGVVDNEGVEIFADKMGVLVARDLAGKHENAVFVADVKSTGLFATDPELQPPEPPRIIGKPAQLYETAHGRNRRAGRL